jgi:tetrapyrrole methylase family protein/MazG family protein
VPSRIVVVGLGPAGAELVTAATLAAIDRVPPERRYLRTARHPAASVVAGARSFDAAYEEEPSFDAVYRRIADELVAAAHASQGEVLYAVPGSPRVLERSVDHLVTAADADAEPDVAVDVRPALSFLDLVWARLGVDPFDEGVRLVDAHRFADRAAGERGPLLVAHCHNRRVLSDVKLAVEDEPDRPVTVLQRLGSSAEAVFDVAWAELDRAVEPDHLTSLWIPALASPVAGEMAALAELVATLRRECPWDRRQTHATLTGHLLEETYEVLDAIAVLPDGADGTEPAYAHLEDELGDLLCQVVLHATLAAEAGAFTLADVARGIHDKLVRRHPHVFAGASSAPDDIARSWEEIKRAETGRASVMDGIPTALPSLIYAAKVLAKATSAGVAVPTPEDGASADLGQRLLALVAEGASTGVDPEASLRAAATRLGDAVRAAEHAG